MAPLFWLILFLFFSLLFVIFMVFNYYSKIKYFAEAQMAPLVSKTTAKLSWKW